MSVEAIFHQRARRAYELGRLQSAAGRAVVVTALAGLLGVATTGARALLALPLTLLVWVFVHWRGDVLARGARYGLLGGVVMTILPLSILRPCCAGGAGPDCRTMPGACMGAGAVVGMLLASVVPFGQAAWWRTAAGVALGMASVAVLKCATLFAGEAVGLVGGLVAGVIAAGAAKAVARRRSMA